MNNTCLLSIRCFVYNQEPYLRQCLDGFVMQKTSFAFEAIVHDDASTDKSAEIIREYAEKYPEIIKPIYETENQYSKHDGSLRRIMDSAISSSSKYVAICEGDDYWTDPYKLQKQVDFLEAHPECTMVCNRTKRYSEKDKHFIEDSFCLEKDGFLDTKDIIRKGGLYISTCSIIYRKSLLVDYPIYCRKCHVGDYPLQIMAAMKGRMYYYNDAMSVYRVQINDSWTSQNNASGYLSSVKLNGIYSEVNMLFSFGNDYKLYERIFHSRSGFYIFSQVRVLGYEDRIKLFKELKSFIEKLPLMWRLLIFSFAYDIPLLKSLLYRIQRKEFVKYISR